MKFKLLIIISLTLFLIYLYKEQNNIYLNTYKVSNSVNKIDTKLQDNKILIYYPNSNYELLDNTITNKISNIISDFKSNLNTTIKQDITYTLDIFYEKYEYKDILSYVFHIDEYLGGAHPSHNIWTISYDKQNNKIIDINTLIDKNSNILNIFSELSRKEFLYNKNIVDTNMMLEGTKPNKENFLNFAFSKEGLILFFEYYQIAPYSSGEFSLVIPYNKLDID